jgi:lysophospholipase L1-like esterase
MLIAFLGDSLTEGWPGAAFFPLLERRVARHALLNRGRAGDTVSTLLARLRRDGLAPVDAAFVWVGVNDALADARDAPGPQRAHGPPTRPARLAADYEALLRWTEARARRIVVVLPLVLEAEGTPWEERAAETAATIAAVAARRGIRRIVDLRPGFAAASREGRGPFTIDGVHFTETGAEVVADALAAVVDELTDAGA